MQGEWTHMQWQLDAYRWYLHNSSPKNERNRYISNHFVFLPQRYDRNVFTKVMRLLSNEGAFGCMIFAVICFTFYMHTFILDNSRSYNLPIPLFTNNIKLKRERVMLAIIMQNPSMFLKTTLISLNKSNHNSDVFIFRNHVVDIIHRDIMQWYSSATIVSDKDRSNSTKIAFFVMERFLSSKYDVLVYVNSYSVLAFDWWDTLMECLKQSPGIFSLYRQETDENQSNACNDQICYQQWLGIVGSVWRRNVAERVMSETLNLDGSLRVKLEFWSRRFKIPLQTVRNPVMTVIDSDKRNYNLFTHKITSLRGNHQLMAVEKVNKDQFRNYSEAIFTLQEEQSFKNQMNSSVKYNAQDCIAAVLAVHIYRWSKANITAYELEQWIRYMQHAGINTVYLYDLYETKDEKLHTWVKQVFEPEEVIYHDWYNKKAVPLRQWVKAAYEHAIDQYKNTCHWHINVDMNEYPSVTNDSNQGFLKRLVTKVKSSLPNCTKIQFPIFQFFGNLTQHHWLIGRYPYRYQRHIYEGFQLYIAKSVKTVDKTFEKLVKGGTVTLNQTEARIHRFLGVGLNTSITNMTQPPTKLMPDFSILSVLRHITNTILITNKMPLFVSNQYWDL